jgi:hypothetical protein
MNTDFFGKRMTLSARALAVLGLTSLLTVPPPARNTATVSADSAAKFLCQNKASYAAPLFSYKLCGMPDIDQRRGTIEPFIGGLPNDGKMYCVPTAAMNCMAYIANHGYPAVEPGPGNWQLGPGSAPNPLQYVEVYNEMTDHLADMGGAMNTHPTQGTTGGGELGIKLWLDSLFDWSGDFVVDGFHATGFYSPRLSDMALSGIDGALVIGVVGWYTNPDGTDHTRDGGHAFTVVRAAGNKEFGEPKTIGIHDPAAPNDGQLGSQSQFATETYPVVDTFGIFDGWPRIHDRLVGSGSAAKGGFIDGYFAIKPKQAFVVNDSTILIYIPFNFVDPEAAGQKVFESATGAKIVDFAVHPERTRHPYLIEGDDIVWQLDAVTGQSTRLAKVQGAKRLVIGGPEQNLYVLGERQLVCLDRDGERRTATRLSARTPVDAIAWDERSNRLVAFSSAAQQVFLYNTELERAGSLAFLTSMLPPRTGARLAMSVAPSDGSIWLHFAGATSALRLRVGEREGFEATEIALEGVQAPEGLYVDERGHVFVTDERLIVELDAEGRRVERSRLAGRQGGSLLQILRPFSNFDPETMVGPAYHDVLPTEFGTSEPEPVE